MLSNKPLILGEGGRRHLSCVYCAWRHPSGSDLHGQIIGAGRPSADVSIYGWHPSGPDLHVKAGRPSTDVCIYGWHPSGPDLHGQIIGPGRPSADVSIDGWHPSGSDLHEQIIGAGRPSTDVSVYGWHPREPDLHGQIIGAGRPSADVSIYGWHPSGLDLHGQIIGDGHPSTDVSVVVSILKDLTYIEDFFGLDAHQWTYRNSYDWYIWTLNTRAILYIHQRRKSTYGRYGTEQVSINRMLVILHLTSWSQVILVYLTYMDMGDVHQQT